ncbi:MAG TPA: organomercurial lyase [Thermoanaerobaculia bacterium]|jgi:hypothetical protein
MDDRVRCVIYDIAMREGVPPTSQRVGGILGIGSNDVLESFRRLADAHMIVLRDDGEILMAGPFSAVATPFRVSAGPSPGASRHPLPEGEGLSCYGNCIWDALGIPAMLHADAIIDTTCAQSSTPAQLSVMDGQLTGDGLMHVVVPARLWWLHIVYT